MKICNNELFENIGFNFASDLFQIYKLEYNVDLCDDDRITSILISFNFQQNQNKIYDLKMKFINISSFRLNSVSKVITIQGLGIDDNLEKGWDSSHRYHIYDYEEDKLSFYCEKIVVTEARKHGSKHGDGSA